MARQPENSDAREFRMEDELVLFVAILRHLHTGKAQHTGKRPNGSAQKKVPQFQKRPKSGTSKVLLAMHLARLISK